MSVLELGENFSLEMGEAVTQTFGIIAAKGGGKTYTAQMLCEGLSDAGAPFLVLDPVGNWSSLALGADGKSPGLPVVVIGGERADVELATEKAEALGVLLVRESVSAVVDLSELRKGARKTFVAELCEALYREARRRREPYMLVLEEAQVFAPQHAARGEERMLGAVTDIVRLGRNYGLGSMLITQRPQSVSKEVLNQVECLFVGQLRGPHERRAIEGWVTEQGVDVGEMTRDLPSLERGEFLLWSPSWLRTFRRVKIGRKRTFDGSATPRLGEKRAAVLRSERGVESVVELLRALGTELDAEEDGSNELAQEVVELDAVGPELAALGASVEELGARVDRLLVDNQRLTEALDLMVKCRPAIAQGLGLLRQVTEGLELALEGLETACRLGMSERGAPPVVEPVQEASERAHPRTARVVPPLERRQQVSKREHARQELAQARRAAGASPALGKPEHALLGVLAAERGAIPRARLALLAGYSANGGAFRNCLSRLRVAGWVEGTTELTLTRAGRVVAPRGHERPTGHGLIAHWMGHPRMDKPMRSILGTLVEVQRPLSRDMLAARAGYAGGAGAFRNALSRLRVLGLVVGKGSEPIRLADVLAEAAKAAA